MKVRHVSKSTVKDGIIQTLSKNMHKIRGFGVKSIGLFGSVLKGSITSNTDVDILVEFEKDSGSFDNLIDLYLFLKDMLGNDRKIDLVTKEALSPYIGPNILKEVHYIEATA